MIANAHHIPDPPDDAFWVFGYGSLMWRPGFEYSSRCKAQLHGYHRALCLLSCVYRGTVELPGLVFGLDAGGSCVGRAFRVEKRHRLPVYDYLMEREMVRGAYYPRWLTVSTPAGRVTALCFVVNRRHEQYAPGLSEREIVDRIRAARGRRGPNIDYILNTCEHLEELGITCRQLTRIRDALCEDAGGWAGLKRQRA
ncbi:MAG TPA: gamma-glutamylcyclotransferase [Arenicellales bacterium]|nr:gamma-glutamylcyclotransferase [Arenicellales bacterium]